MSPAQEKKFLLELCKRFDHSEPGFMESRFFLPTLWVMLVIVFMLMFNLADQGSLSTPAVTIAAAVVGACVGWILFYLTAHKQWPVLRPYIDRTGVEKRLHELG